jgi:ribosome recycling factor
MPQLTEERRKELVRGLQKQTEEQRVAVRNVRRDGLDQLKKLRKDGLPEDAERQAEADIQKLTDKYIAEIDQISAAKEKDILEV